MMNQHQQDVRRAAARAFNESLDQLCQSLEAPSSPAITPPPESQAMATDDSPLAFDLYSFEQAVADIEAFIATQQQAGE